MSAAAVLSTGVSVVASGATPFATGCASASEICGAGSDMIVLYELVCRGMCLDLVRRFGVLCVAVSIVGVVMMEFDSRRCGGACGGASEVRSARMDAGIQQRPLNIEGWFSSIVITGIILI
jgi:hypothetical protein